MNSQVVNWRRHLHENPELSFQEIKTSKFVYETLESFGNFELSRPTKTSVMARLIGTNPGKVLALRADMDALPIQEETGLPFSSRNSGVMHACGHDGHTAMLLGAAKVLSTLKEHISGEIRFFFQHAEELIPGGAQEMVKAGVTEGVDGVIGLHLASQEPLGHFGIIYGPAMAAADTFDVLIQGKGGHASRPHDTIDPVAIAVQLINGINQFISRKVDSSQRVVLSVTKIQGSDAHNIIPDSVTFGGSIRTFDPEIRKQIPIWIEKYVKGSTEANDCSYQMKYESGYSSVVNEKYITSLVEQTLVEEFGKEQCNSAEPVMGSEDFSAFSNEVPGCFVFLGAGSEDNEENYPHHHPKFMIKEEALELGVIYYVKTALNYLNDYEKVNQ
nr:amidohydrolase [Cytobacillus purgationiresistens]